MYSRSFECPTKKHPLPIGDRGRMLLLRCGGDAIIKIIFFDNPAILGGPVALRRRVTPGLPLSKNLPGPIIANEIKK
jgi:hypothetical protein